jgi:cob(I)alamin adenosyltransferase
MKYINRLSDLFFIMARKYHQGNEIKLAKGNIKEKAV